MAILGGGGGIYYYCYIFMRFEKEKKGRETHVPLTADGACHIVQVAKTSSSRVEGQEEHCSIEHVRSRIFPFHLAEDIFTAQGTCATCGKRATNGRLKVILSRIYCEMKFN